MLPVNRYPAPYAQRIWSDQARSARMRGLTDKYTVEALRGMPAALVDPERALSAMRAVLTAPKVLPEAWRDAEAECGHEIVGFLAAYLDRLPPEVKPHVHYGLTSSDLVEYDLHEALAEHAFCMAQEVELLRRLLSAQAQHTHDLPRAGRTHGQTAEATTLGHQLAVFEQTLGRIEADLDQASNDRPIKSPGPTGVSDRPIPDTFKDRVVLSTQIVPRDFLLRWASAYLNLSNAMETMAMFVRLGARSEVGEFQEGAAASRHGSSAMPGKRNPIQSEKVCGLARISRGHFLALAEVSALWEDRDLSNSSTERIAVPGLASTVEHMLLTVVSVFQDLVIDEDRIRLNAQDPRCSTNETQRWMQTRQQVGPIEASRLANQKEPTP